MPISINTEPNQCVPPFEPPPSTALNTHECQCMPSIVHNHGFRSLSIISTAVNPQQRRFSHYLRSPLATNPRRLPSATTFNRGLVDASLSWRWLFLRHVLIQLRGLRIRKTLVPPRD